jgi:hypothetical protein
MTEVFLMETDLDLYLILKRFPPQSVTVRDELGTDCSVIRIANVLDISFHLSLTVVSPLSTRMDGRVPATI